MVSAWNAISVIILLKVRAGNPVHVLKMMMAATKMTTATMMSVNMTIRSRLTQICVFPMTVKMMMTATATAQMVMLNPQLCGSPVGSKRSQ
jgi:hypothetical protein